MRPRTLLILLVLVLALASCGSDSGIPCPPAVFVEAGTDAGADARPKRTLDARARDGHLADVGREATASPDVRRHE